MAPFLLLVVTALAFGACRERDASNDTHREADRMIPLLDAPSTYAARDELAASLHVDEKESVRCDALEYGPGNWSDSTAGFLGCLYSGGVLDSIRLNNVRISYAFGEVVEIDIEFADIGDRRESGFGQYDRVERMISRRLGAPLWASPLDTIPVTHVDERSLPAIHQIASNLYTEYDERRGGRATLWKSEVDGVSWVITSDTWDVGEFENDTMRYRVVVRIVPIGQQQRLAEKLGVRGEAQEFRGLLMQGGDVQTWFLFGSCDSALMRLRDSSNHLYNDSLRDLRYNLYYSERIEVLGNPFNDHKVYYAFDSSDDKRSGQPSIKKWTELLGADRFVRFRGYLIDARFVESGRRGVIVEEVIDAVDFYEGEFDCD